MVEHKAIQPGSERSLDNPSRLSPEDQAQFQNGVGLIRTSAVDPTYYNQRYFSADHVAYTEGYNLDGRLEKYADAISNIERLLDQPVLDLGCGPGYIVEGLRRAGVEAQGVDISREAIEQISPEATRPLLHVAPLTALPFADGEFASGYSFHVMEHLTLPELEKAFAEISRVIKDKLYLIIPTWDSLINQDLFAQIVLNPTHRVIVNRQWWIDQFARFGWEHNGSVAGQLDRIDRGWVFFFERNQDDSQDTTLPQRVR